MKRIGIVVNSLGFGGNERSVENIADCISDFCEVFVILLDGRQVSKTFRGNIIDLNTPPSGNIIMKIFNSFVRSYKLKKAIKKYSLDIIYLFLPKTNILNYIKYKNCKKIVSCRDCGDLIRNTDKYNRMLDKSDMIIFNSEYMKDFFLKQYPKNTTKCKVVYNILATQKINELKEEENLELAFKDFRSLHKSIIISVGRFCYEKGFNNLIKAFDIISKKDNTIGLVLIGDGALLKDAQAMIADSNIANNILFLGFQQNPYKYLKHCDIFALSSFSEGFPNVILEAMACGLPIVSTDCHSGPSEILSPDDITEVKTGFKYSKYGIRTANFNSDASDWILSNKSYLHTTYAAAINLLLNDNNLYNYYKKAAKKRSLDFSADIIKKDWKEIIMLL